MDLCRGEWNEFLLPLKFDLLISFDHSALRSRILLETYLKRNLAMPDVTLHSRHVSYHLTHSSEEEEKLSSSDKKPQTRPLLLASFCVLILVAAYSTTILWLRLAENHKVFLDEYSTHPELSAGMPLLAHIQEETYVKVVIARPSLTAV